MDQPPAGTPIHDSEDAALIDTALAAPAHALNFEPRLEVLFRAEGRADRLRYQRRVGYIGVALNALSLLTAGQMVPDVARLALAMAVVSTACGVILLPAQMRTRATLLRNGFAARSRRCGSPTWPGRPARS